ncbi:PAS domain S-box-containing protein [Marinospirillum celere]|uniref:histidine kinase n=1 Tax=Marinospirillum celere TaxID=1122252 RepID=A0A1I1J666_9GAMM|nr:sensor histidine kinase [Marinospirillum celere]SFC43966.1 PAS domain S-box-containing protein [Marinospirillum celere]
MKSLKILHKVSLLGLGVLVLVSFVLITGLRSNLPKEVSRLLLLEQQSDAEWLAAQAQSALSERQKALQYLAEVMIENDQLLPVSQLNQRLQLSVPGRQLFNGGLGVFDINAIGIAEAPINSNRIGLNIADRAHVQQVRATLQPVITRPLVSRSLDRPSFFINVPLLDSKQQLLGFLIGVTILTENNFLLDVGHDSTGMGGLFYVLDETNELIVTASDPSQAMQLLPEDGMNPLIDSVRRGNVSGRARHKDGEYFIFATASVPQMNWTIVRAVPEALVQQPMQELINKLLKASVMLVIAGGLILFLLLHRLLAPLKQATANIDAMSAGQQPVELLKVKGQDEVAQLVAAFNRLFFLLDEQRQRLSLATSSAGVGIWEYRVETGELIWDEQMFRLYGRDAGDFSGAYSFWEQGLHPDDLQRAKTELQQSIDQRRAFDTEFRVLHPDGSIHWIKANGRVQPQSEQGDTRVIGTNWDITERKQAEIAKNQFISTVSHELRTPLTSIRGVLGLAAHGQLGVMPDTAQPMLESALRNAEHLTQLVNDLLDMDKLESGEMHFELVELDLLALLRESIDRNQSFADQHQVTLRLQPDAVCTPVLADPQRLHQVMSNLLSNAIKFSLPGSRVEIHFERFAEHVRVSVTDQGQGVPEAFRDRIFQRFAQADASDTRQKGGTGLGLAITRAVIEKMQGEIGYESSPGQGSVFYFTISAARNHPHKAF